MATKQKTMDESFLETLIANRDDPTHRQIYADWLEDQERMEESNFWRGCVIKEIGIDFDYNEDDKQQAPALTLNAGEVSDDPHNNYNKECSRTHEDGWTITGIIHEDYYIWVNDFIATHPTLGKVFGNFEGIVFAQSEEAFQHFYENHTPNAWNHWDI